MKTSLIVAYNNDNRAIGFENQLLFDIPDDLKRFREITLNKPIIMGKETFLSIGNPLPKRDNIILSKNEKFKTEILEKYNNVKVHSSIEEALKNRIEDELIVIGGSSIYKQFIDEDLIDKYYLTIILGEVKDRNNLPKAFIGYKDDAFYLADVDISVSDKNKKDHGFYTKKEIKADSFFSELNLENFECVEFENKYENDVHYINITFERTKAL